MDNATTAPRPLDAAQTYVFLGADGAAAVVPGGDAFWSQTPAQMDRFSGGWLVAEFDFTGDWPHWEMHPAADEFVYLLSGEADFVLDLPGGATTTAMRGSGAVVVPRGVWHIAKTSTGARMLFVTRGEGTQHRPAD